MNQSEFTAAVGKIIGMPPNRPQHETAKTWWLLQVPNGNLAVEIDLHRVLLQFTEEFRPGIGENPVSGRWNIYPSFHNDDPEAVLRELSRRLAAAGYEPPAAEVPAVSPGDVPINGLFDLIRDVEDVTRKDGDERIFSLMGGSSVCNDSTLQAAKEELAALTAIRDAEADRQTALEAVWASWTQGADFQAAVSLVRQFIKP